MSTGDYATALRALRVEAERADTLPPERLPERLAVALRVHRAAFDALGEHLDLLETIDVNPAGLWALILALRAFLDAELGPRSIQ